MSSEEARQLQAEIDKMKVSTDAVQCFLHAQEDIIAAQSIIIVMRLE